MAQRFLSLFLPGTASVRLIELVEWCDRYSPLVSADGGDGIVFDITGCAHLFGGEGPLLIDLQRRLHKLGNKSKGAIADTWGIAWALARYGNKFIVRGRAALAALDPLPVEALRLSEETVGELRRLGLATVASVRAIPHSSLTARFGETLPRRLDRILGKAGEPLTPWRPPAPYRASRILAEPVTTTTAVEYILNALLEEICSRLERNRLGARRLDLACYRLDGTVDRCEVRTSKPTRSLRHLLRIFEDRLGKLDSGFGFETLVLSVLDRETLGPAQLGLWQTDTVEEESSLSALADRLGMRFGFQEVNRVRVRESFLPEFAVELCPATVSSGTSAIWPAYRVRPVRMIDPPMPIEVSVLIPGESPVQFFIGRERHAIVRSEGPERLTSEWWREKNPRSLTRDYYRVEDNRGLRFWIFCDSSGQWFLHGHFA